MVLVIASSRCTVRTRTVSTAFIGGMGDAGRDGTVIKTVTSIPVLPVRARVLPVQARAIPGVPAGPVAVAQTAVARGAGIEMAPHRLQASARRRPRTRVRLRGDLLALRKNVTARRTARRAVMGRVAVAAAGS